MWFTSGAWKGLDPGYHWEQGWSPGGFGVWWRLFWVELGSGVFWDAVRETVGLHLYPYMDRNIKYEWRDDGMRENIRTQFLSSKHTAQTQEETKNQSPELYIHTNRIFLKETNRFISTPTHFDPAPVFILFLYLYRCILLASRFL